MTQIYVELHQFGEIHKIKTRGPARPLDPRHWGAPLGNHRPPNPLPQALPRWLLPRSLGRAALHPGPDLSFRDTLAGQEGVGTLYTAQYTLTYNTHIQHSLKIKHSCVAPIHSTPM